MASPRAEQEGEDLRKHYEEAVTELEDHNKLAGGAVADAVVGAVAKSKWVTALGDAGTAALDDIRAAIEHEQRDGQLGLARVATNLREAIDNFVDGMAKQLHEVQSFTKEANKDAMRVQRAASSKEVDNAMAKQGYELNQEKKEMQEKYEEELARLRAQLKQQKEASDVEIEGLKMALRKKNGEIEELQARYDNLAAECAAFEAELGKLRELCKDQEAEIGELREKLAMLAGLRDDYDQMMANIELRVGSILKEVRKEVHIVHTAVPQSESVMAMLETTKEASVLGALHEAIGTLLSEREAHLKELSGLRDQVANADMQHEKDMAELRRTIKKLQDEIDVLKNGSASKIHELRARIEELEKRVDQLLEDKRALTVALESQVRRVDDDHKRIQLVMQEQEKYLSKYRQRIAELESGQNDRKKLELAMVAENRKTSELRHLSRLCTRLLRDKDEKSSELADAISRAQEAANSFGE